MMSDTSRLLINFGSPVPHLMSPTILERSTNDDRSDSSLEPSITEEETICLQDYFNSPEFMEEQRVILLEIETERLRINDERKAPPQGEEVLSRRSSRRSSIGIKLTCPICLESFGSVRSGYVKMVTECGHVFCKDCIESVCKTDAEGKKGHVALCPVCRKEVGELRKVYF